MRAAIFIDGGYFLNRLKEDGVVAEDLEYERIADYLLKPLRRELPVDLLRCYFYDCPPWMPEDPNEEESRRLEVYKAFIAGIERTSRWQVRLGKLERRWEGKQKYFEQKRVDVMLSVDLVRHAAAGHIQHAVMIAGDSDFIPAVQAAKESGVTVSIWGGAPKSIHMELGWMADELHRFDHRAFTVGQPRPEPPQRRPRTPGTPARRKTR